MGSFVDGAEPCRGRGECPEVAAGRSRQVAGRGDGDGDGDGSG